MTGWRSICKPAVYRLVKLLLREKRVLTISKAASLLRLSYNYARLLVKEAEDLGVIRTECVNRRIAHTIVMVKLLHLTERGKRWFCECAEILKDSEGIEICRELCQ